MYSCRSWVLSATAAAAVGVGAAIALHFLREEARKEKRISLTLLLHNVSKPRNMENAIACAAVFGFEEVVVVGRRKESVGSSPSSPGNNISAQERAEENTSALRFKHYKYLSAVKNEFADCRSDDQKKRVIVGLEIMPEAVTAANLFPTIQAKYSSCEQIVLLPGNEGTGLSDQEKILCDMFVIVPQFCVLSQNRLASGSKEEEEHAPSRQEEEVTEASTGGVGSMNVITALAVVMHQLRCAQN